MVGVSPFIVGMYQRVRTGSLGTVTPTAECYFYLT